MLKITQRQMVDLSRALQDAFVRRTVRHLMERFPEELRALALLEKDLEPLVRRGLAEAESFGVVHEPDVKLYVECMVVLHPEFARDPQLPWAREILEREDLSGEEKMDRVHDHLIFSVYQRLQQ